MKLKQFVFLTGMLDWERGEDEGEEEEEEEEEGRRRRRKKKKKRRFIGWIDEHRSSCWEPFLSRGKNNGCVHPSAIQPLEIISAK